MSYPIYQYSPLSPARDDSIRLLKLHAGSGRGQLSCELLHDSLSLDPPKFEALSYVWGQTEPSLANVYITTRGGRQRLPILSNLRDALYRLRLANEDRFIWVDALCINQSDNAEKNKQVPLMGQIYRSARSVVIWLGEAAEDSDLVISFIPRVTDLSQFDQIIKDQSSTREWYALSKLMNRPWFSRRWVVQELAFAKEAKLYCGTAEVDWTLFADAATLFGERQQDIAKLFWLSPEYAHDAEIFGEVQALGALRLINALNRLFCHSDDGEILESLVDLESLVTSLNVFRTTDPRDCIYAVMPLAGINQSLQTWAFAGWHEQQSPAEIDTPKLPIDYGCAFHLVARRFVASCIKSSNSLDIICRPWAPFPNYYQSDCKTTLLSSWACSMEDAVFEIRGDGHYMRKRGDSFVGTPGRPIYQASKDFPFFSFEPKSSQQNSTQYLEMVRFSHFKEAIHSWTPRMRVKAAVIGTILTLGERAMEGTIPSGWFLMGDWNQRLAPVPEAFYRTLVADRTTDGSNPPSWYKRVFEHALVGSGTGDVRLQRMITQSRSTVTTELLQRVQSVIWNRRFVITTDRACGLVPANAQTGDIIVVLYGASVPMVIHPFASRNILVGECYIHGAMDGLKSFHPNEKVIADVEGNLDRIVGSGAILTLL